MRRGGGYAGRGGYGGGNKGEVGYGGTGGGWGEGQNGKCDLSGHARG